MASEWHRRSRVTSMTRMPQHRCTIVLKVRRIGSRARRVPLPAYATRGSSGLDLRAAIGIVLEQGSFAVVPTGVAVEIPVGYEGQVRGRSGLTARNGVVCLNSPGTIDSDYRGEIGVVLANTGKRPVRLRAGDRIAQLVIAPVVQVTVREARPSTKASRRRGAP